MNLLIGLLTAAGVLVTAAGWWLVRYRAWPRLRRLAGIIGSIERRLEAVERRIEAASIAQGHLAADSGARDQALGQAVGQFANDTAARLEAIKAIVNDHSKRIRRLDDRAQLMQTALGLMQSALWAEHLAELHAPFHWRGALESAMQSAPPAVAAEAFLRSRPSASRPIDLRCSDGHVYVVKPQIVGDAQRTRALVPELVVTRLGLLIAAPVPASTTVDIPAALIDRHPADMAHVRPGIGHGSRFVPRLGERCEDVLHVEHNRSRFARIAILHAWAHTNDYHFLYETEAPFRVYSVDHSGFFVDGMEWSAERLSEAALVRAADHIVDPCGLTHAELVAAAAPLRQVTPQQIAAAVAAPPAEWGISMDDRIAICRYLRIRQLQLLAVYGLMTSASRQWPRAAD